MLSRRFLDFSVDEGAFVTGLSQISSFFSYITFVVNYFTKISLYCMHLNYFPSIFLGLPYISFFNIRI